MPDQDQGIGAVLRMMTTAGLAAHLGDHDLAPDRDRHRATRRPVYACQLLRDNDG